MAGRVSVGLKIHAESSSNGSSRPASHITGASYVRWTLRRRSGREILNELCDLFLDVLGLGSLHQKPRVGGTLGGVLCDGSDGWRSPVPRGDNTGGRVHLPPQPAIAFSVPPTDSVHRDASFIMCIVTGSSFFWDFGSLYSTTLRRHSSQLLRQRHSLSVRSCGVPGADC